MKSVRKMVEQANAEVPHAPAAQLLDALEDPDTLFIDLRDIREIERDGIIPGAFHCPRGMLEFWIDPDSPYAKPQFQSGKQILFYCASGWRSALSAQTAQNMGVPRVGHVDDGFAGWKAAGGPVAKKTRT